MEPMGAPELVGGVVAIGLGAACMLFGYRLALVLLPIWGFFAGFLIGAQIVQALVGGGFLGAPIGWVVGGVIGLAFGALSYAFWYVAVVIAFGSVGYWLVWAGMTLLGFPEAGLEPIGIGLIGGAIFAIVGLLLGVPLVALVVVTAVGGAHAFVVGVLLVLGTIDVGALGTGVVTAVIRASVGWWLAALGLSLISITIQLQTIGEFVLEPPTTRV
jgi:hypothetical protein